MNCDDRFCSSRKRREGYPYRRVWCYHDTGRTFSFWETASDIYWSQGNHRYVSTSDMWCRAVIFPSECHQWYRCSTLAMSHASYPRKRWYTDRRVHATSGKAGHSGEWLCQEAPSTESTYDDPEARGNTTARWCCRCSGYSISCESEGEEVGGFAGWEIGKLLLFKLQVYKVDVL